MPESFRMKDEKHMLDPIANRRGAFPCEPYTLDFEEELQRELERSRVEVFRLKKNKRDLTDRLAGCKC